MAERGITVSYESIRQCCNKFGTKYVKRLKRRHQGFGDAFFIDEVFVKIQERQYYPWRAVDQDGDTIDLSDFAVRGRAKELGLKTVPVIDRFINDQHGQFGGHGLSTAARILSV